MYVLVAVRMFLEEWQGMDEIGVFIDKLLEACDSLLPEAVSHMGVQSGSSEGYTA